MICSYRYIYTKCTVYVYYIYLKKCLLHLRLIEYQNVRETSKFPSQRPPSAICTEGREVYLSWPNDVSLWNQHLLDHQAPPSGWERSTKCQVAYILRLKMPWTISVPPVQSTKLPSIQLINFSAWYLVEFYCTSLPVRVPPQPRNDHNPSFETCRRVDSDP